MPPQVPTLARIRTKVRRLTSSPGTSQLSEADLDNAINDFYTLSLPGHLRTFNLEKTYTFYTQANVDVYDFPKDLYSSVSQPLLISGYESDWYQDRESFFRRWPIRDYDQDLVTGDGTVGPFTGTITNVPILRRGPVTGAAFEPRVLISAIDSTGATIIAEDTSVTGDVGTLSGIGVASGTINYITGAVSITFDNAIVSPNVINSQTVSYVASRPLSALFYADQLTIRPVPDKAYKCQLNAYILPTTLIADADTPEIAQWWEFIAFGAAKKIFEERQDMDGLQSIFGSYKEQETIALRRTIVQNSQKRIATIYSDGGQENNSSGYRGSF
jgi:hypothetical protein